MPFATTADGARICYDVRGTRGPFVFLGPGLGAGTAPRRWPKFLNRYPEALAQDHRVILVDQLRGSGRSDAKYPERYTPDVAVADLLTVADAAGARRFAWCGFSWGAVLGLQMALRSDRVAALLCGGWPPLDGHYAQVHRMAATMAGRIPFRWVRKAREAGTLYEQFYRELLAWSPEQQRRDLARIGCPKLLFIGDRDKAGGGLAATVRRTEPELKALGWEVRWLPGQSHLVSTKPEVVVPVLREFLERSRAGVTPPESPSAAPRTSAPPRTPGR